MIKLLVAGDFCPKDRVADLIEKSNYEVIFSEVKPIFDQSDYSILNLEAPIVTDCNISAIQKVGPSLKCSDNAIGALKYLGIKCTTLANNHHRDYGDKGVLNTIKLLKNAGIDYVGSGKNAISAKETLYKEINGCKIAILNCCEHEFSIANDDNAGSNPLNPIQQYYAITEARMKADFVIVIVHGGMEHCQLPSPRMAETYRFFIDVGADAVINHHQHCFSGYEIHNDRPIFYGLGNFCFDWAGKRNSIWNEGYMINLYLEKNKRIKFEIIPYEQCNGKPCVKLKDNNGISEINHKIEHLNNIISNPLTLNNEFEKYLDETAKSYDIISIWDNRYLKALYRRGFLPSLLSIKTLRSVYNNINCESHRERFLHFLNEKTEGKPSDQ